MTHVIIVQSITQPVSILLLTHRWSSETFEKLISNFIGNIGSGFFLSNFFHPFIDALEHLDLMPNNLWSHSTAASANDREAFVFRF